MKIVTLSFDDGILQDERLIGILDECGLKCTFNLNSGLLGNVDALPLPGKTVNHTKVSPDRVRSLYAGHEVAAHTLHHPDLKALPHDKIVEEVERDRTNLEALAGKEVIGFAYPGGHPNYNECVLSAVRVTGVRYARNIENTGGFSLPEDFLLWRPTVQADDPVRLNRTVDRFFSEADEGIRVLFIWGHSYEFDYYDTWEEIGHIFRRFKGRKDVVPMTNGEIYRLCKEKGI